MKECFTLETGDGLRICIADLCPISGSQELMLTRINVPRMHRGKGLGSRLLDEVLAAADEEGVTIVLGVSPSGGLNYKQLEAWYKRKGFVRVWSGAYRRTPKNKE